MTLKERVLNRKPTITKEEMDAYDNSEDAKKYDLFLDICERIQSTVDCSQIRCSTYKQVFDIIEQYKVYVFDIVSENDYEEFKKYMLESKAQCCPSLGKAPDKVYDFNNEKDREEIMEIYGRGQF